MKQWKKIRGLAYRLERILYRLSVFFWKKRRISLTQILVRQKYKLPKQVTNKRYSDLVRYYTLELCAEIIYKNNVKGNVAELGVYKGEFSAQINRCFSDRKLYLFDTFEGFDGDQFLNDKNLHSNVKNIPFQTSVEEVLKNMPFPDSCIIKKGVFRGKNEKLEDRFAFVSLDADLFEPIYEGLNFFYPKLNKGGYIFIHDYNNPDWPGVKEAVSKFLVENNISCVPIADAQGTAIITTCA